MRRQTRRAWIVAVTTLIGALAGAGVGDVLTGDTARYESVATVAVVPFPDLPEDLSADFWQVLSEQQVVRTAATIYGNGQWAADAAESLGVPGAEVELSAYALVDTTLVQVRVESDSAETSDTVLAMVLGSASTAAADILQPFVITEASTQPAVAARADATLQLIGAAAVSGALVGAGAGIVLAGIRRRNPGGGDADPVGPVDPDGIDRDPAERHPADRDPAERHPADRDPADRDHADADADRADADRADVDRDGVVAGRHAAGTDPAAG